MVPRFGEGLVLLIIAAALAYMVQLFLTNVSRSAAPSLGLGPESRVQESFMFRGLNCLASETELAFDNCVARLHLTPH